MIRSLLITGLLAALPLSGAAAQSEELTAAVDSYLQEDYSNIDVIARHADNGVPEAIAILGQAYLYGYGVTADTPLGVALLEQAASLGERSSAVQLGRVYEFGTTRIPVDLSAAATWYVKAAEEGDTTSAPTALKRLPAAVVIEAGGAAWADAVADTGTGSGDKRANTPPAPQAPASALAAATRTVFSEQETAAAETPAPPGTSPGNRDEPDAQRGLTTQAQSPASAILGTDSAPPAIKMNDQTSFPVFADTRLSRIADAAASCFVVLKPEIERQRLALDSLMKLDGFGNTETDQPRYQELADTDNRLKSMTAAMRASEDLLADTKRNGGLTSEAVSLALMPHRDALQSRPGTGPTASFCGQRLVSLIGESAGWTSQ